jgi:hypothetical protein
MTLKRILSILSVSAVVFTSCKNSLNIQAPYKDITVVYGLIDQNDPIHYFRINKAFEGLGDAYTMASQFDSIYYLPTSSITAVLEDSSITTNTIVKTYTLDTTTAVPLGAGTFSYPKQILYYTNAVLNPNDYYNLVITNNKTGKTLRGSTALLSDVSFVQYSPATSPFYLGSNPFPSQVEWNSSLNGRIYQMSLLFYYDNQVGSGSRVLQAPLTLVFAPQTSSTLAGGDLMTCNVSAQQLFTLITSSLQYIPGVSRYADSLGIIFTSGTDDLNTYIQLSQPPTGINQDIPSFSDVSNGVGLYTARHVQTFYDQMDGVTLDSIQGLNAEQRFINLGFQP